MTLTDQSPFSIITNELKQNGADGMLQAIKQQGTAFDINTAGPHMDRTLLHIAAGMGDREATESLITKFDADLESKDAHGKTPLIVAAMDCQPRSIEVLLLLGAKPDACDNLKCTAMHEACSCTGATQERLLESMRLLAQAGSDFGAKNSQGQTPRDVAVTELAKRVMDGWAEQQRSALGKPHEPPAIIAADVDEEEDPEMHADGSEKVANIAAVQDRENGQGPNSSPPTPLQHSDSPGLIGTHSDDSDNVQHQGQQQVDLAAGQGLVDSEATQTDCSPDVDAIHSGEGLNDETTASVGQEKGSNEQADQPVQGENTIPGEAHNNSKDLSDEEIKNQVSEVSTVDGAGEEEGVAVVAPVPISVSGLSGPVISTGKTEADMMA